MIERYTMAMVEVDSGHHDAVNEYLKNNIVKDGEKLRVYELEEEPEVFEIETRSYANPERDIPFEGEEEA